MDDIKLMTGYKGYINVQNGKKAESPSGKLRTVVAIEADTVVNLYPLDGTGDILMGIELNNIGQIFGRFVKVEVTAGSTIIYRDCDSSQVTLSTI